MGYIYIYFKKETSISKFPMHVSLIVTPVQQQTKVGILCVAGRFSVRQTAASLWHRPSETDVNPQDKHRSQFYRCPS